LEDYCLLEILGNEMECGEKEEHGLDGATFDDDDPLQCLFALDRQSSLIIATGYCCDSAANDRDEKQMQAWLCHNTMHSEDASDSDDLFDPFEGIMSLTRQFSNSSQNSLSHVFPDEFGLALSRQFSNSSQDSLSHVFPDEFGDEFGLAEARERSHVEKRSCSGNVGIVHDSTIYPESSAGSNFNIRNPELSMREALSFLPTPLQLKTDWSKYQPDFISPNTPESPCTPIIIPQLSREILMEGVPSKEKRRKIARYLEKRRRRIEKRQMEKKIPSYPARSNVASSRVRRGGRFVCSSEWGKRIRPPRNN